MLRYQFVRITYCHKCRFRWTIASGSDIPIL